MLIYFDGNLQLKPRFIPAKPQDGPAIMPRCQMLRLLLSLVDTTPREVSQEAGQVLIKVCESASGDDGCALAEQDEINELLNSLKLANVNLRIVSLEVRGHKVIA